jgi:predicted amidohydrolase
MTTIRIGVASTPLTATLEEAVPAALAAVEGARRLGASIVCLPETGLPGHRDQPRSVPGLPRTVLDDPVDDIAEAARVAEIVVIVGTERPTPAGRQILSVVIGADGARLGEQAKTQIDPSEEVHYTPGTGRRVFTAAGVTFGIAICHEVPLPGDSSLARPRRCAGRLRPALRDDRRRLAPEPLARCVESIQRKGAPVPRWAPHRNLRAEREAAHTR